jgi:hypothetical protein
MRSMCIRIFTAAYHNMPPARFTRHTCLSAVGSLQGRCFTSVDSISIFCHMYLAISVTETGKCAFESRSFRLCIINRADVAGNVRTLLRSVQALYTDLNLYFLGSCKHRGWTFSEHKWARPGFLSGGGKGAARKFAYNIAFKPFNLLKPSGYYTMYHLF